MTRLELILIKVIEEACELGQAATKSLRFGLESNYDGRNARTNAETICDEFADLAAALQLLREETPLVTGTTTPEFLARKQRIEQYLKKSKELGILTED